MKRAILGAAALVALAAAGPAASNVPVLIDHVVISEVMPNAPGSNEQGAEWFELYNPGPVGVNIGGWYVHDKDSCDFVFGRHTFPEGTMLGAQEYLHVVIPAEAKVCLANGGDDLTLLDPLGNAVDAVWYGTGGDYGSANAAPAPPEAQSIARCHLVAGVAGLNLDNDEPAAEFYVDLSPTPGAANEACLPAAPPA